MLPKKEKISPKTFNELFKNSKIVSRGYFFVVRCKKTESFRASVVISKKIAKKATERNKIKRWTYSLLSNKNNKNKGFLGDYIIIFQKKPLLFIDLKNDFQTTFL